MLVLLIETSAVPSWSAGAALREALGVVGRPSAFLDAASLLRVCPESMLSNLDRVARLMSVADPAVDAFHRDGVRSLVVSVPVDLERWAAKLALLLARTHDETAFIIAAPEPSADVGTWARAIAARLLAGDHRLAIAPMEPVIPRVQTARLRLGPATRSQLDGFYHATVGTDIFRWLIWDGPTHVDDVLNHDLKMRQAWARGPIGGGGFAIIESSSGAMIGNCGWKVSHPPDLGRVEIGYALAPAFHGRGLGREAIAAMMDFLAVERAPERIAARVFHGNEPSRRLLERLGFVLEGTLHHHTPKRGTRENEWLYSTTSERYLVHRQAPQGS